MRPPTGEDMLEDLELEQSWRHHGDPATEHHSPAPSHSEDLTALSSHSPEALKAFREVRLFSNSSDKNSGLGHMLVSEAMQKQGQGVL